jgi:hypothetical protein
LGTEGRNDNQQHNLILVNPFQTTEGDHSVVSSPHHSSFPSSSPTGMVLLLHPPPPMSVNYLPYFDPETGSYLYQVTYVTPDNIFTEPNMGDENNHNDMNGDNDLDNNDEQEIYKYYCENINADEEQQNENMVDGSHYSEEEEQEPEPEPEQPEMRMTVKQSMNKSVIFQNNNNNNNNNIDDDNNNSDPDGFGSLEIPESCSIVIGPWFEEDEDQKNDSGNNNENNTEV